MDADDELRAALNAHRAESDRDARATERAAQDRAKFEHDVEGVKRACTKPPS